MPPWWMSLVYLACALALSTVIGIERQVHNKSAGMRTHALVGLGSALFMVVSKYGFYDVLVTDLIRLDPSRIAGQIVSGIGFIGAGLIVMRRGAVRGLTTAASIWLTAAVGTAAGGGLLIPASAVTAGYLVAVVCFPWISRRIRVLRNSGAHLVRVRYTDGTGALRSILAECTESGFAVQGFSLESDSDLGGSLPARRTQAHDAQRAAEIAADDTRPTDRRVVVELELIGGPEIDPLLARLSDMDHVHGVRTEADEG